MNWVGFATMLIVVLVGAGMYFTGYTMGMQWVLSNTVIEVAEDEGADSSNKQAEPNDKQD